MLNVQRIAWPLIVVLVLSAGVALHAAIVPDAKAPPQWEYKALQMGVDRQTHERILNKVGGEGWELSALTADGNNAITAYVKRRK